MLYSPVWDRYYTLWELSRLRIRGGAKKTFNVTLQQECAPGNKENIRTSLDCKMAIAVQTRSVTKPLLVNLTISHLKLNVSFSICGVGRRKQWNSKPDPREKEVRFEDQPRLSWENLQNVQTRGAFEFDLLKVNIEVISLLYTA